MYFTHTQTFACQTSLPCYTNQCRPYHAHKKVCNVVRSDIQLTRAATQLVPSCARSSIALALQTEQHFLEAREVCRVRARPCNRLALRVLELDDCADALPSGTLRERGREVCEELLLMLPIADMRNGMGREDGTTHLFSRMLRSFFAAYSS